MKGLMKAKKHKAEIVQKKVEAVAIEVAEAKAMEEAMALPPEEQIIEKPSKKVALDGEVYKGDQFGPSFQFHSFKREIIPKLS